jgi:solute carrier family 13 (sodium-dependent dicarboxylate transporter), member 2/3/5
VLGVASSDDVFGAFVDSTIFLFIGSFIIAEAMLVHGLDRRFAYNILGLRWVGDSTSRIIIAFGIMASVGRLITNQVEEDRPERLRFGAALMLVITYGITVGGLLLPIGSPPNLIGRGLIEEATQERITFVEWFLAALPIVLVMFVALLAVILFLNRPEVRRVEGAREFIAEERRKLGRLTSGERNTLIAFGLAVLLWTIPGLVGMVLGDDSALYEGLSDRYLDEGVVAIVCAGLLFLLPIDWARRQFTLNWNQAAHIDWGTILLFGSGIALGSLMRSTGLANTIGEGLADTLNVSSLMAITIICVLIAVLISETTSNTASAAIVVPIAISISGAVFDVIGAVLCVVGVTVMAKLVGLA